MDSAQLRDHFDRHAAEFDALYDAHRQSPFTRWLNRNFRSDIVARYEASIAHVQAVGARSVLDVGCGPGHYLAALTRAGVPRLVGIDVSEQMISLARNNAGISRSSGVELVQADYVAWKSDAKFDVVLALGFFDYVSDPIRLLIKMRDDATHSVVASFPSRHWFRTPFRWIRRRLQGTRVYFYTEAEVRELAAQAGFPQIEVRKFSGAGMNLLAVLRM